MRSIAISEETLEFRRLNKTDIVIQAFVTGCWENAGAFTHGRMDGK